MTGQRPGQEELERGRSAYGRRDWKAAREAFRRADDATPLSADDLWLLAVSAYLMGREDEYVAALERAHHLHLDAGDPAAASRCAFWIGMHLFDRGEPARASGWLGRADRLLQQDDADRVERGYLLLPAARRSLARGDAAAAFGLAGEAVGVGSRLGDRDLVALAVHLQGRIRLVQARVEEGLGLLDEAMVAVATGELSAIVTGLIFCSVISACRSVYALGRAREWTSALAGWCDRQPDMVAYTGECRLHRAELMRFRGDWRESLAEARRAGERLPAGAGPTVSLALYQQGEAYRLLGQLGAAEEAFRAASRAGREPQPGLALLRLAQGEPDAAAAALRRALTEAGDPLQRARLLPAYIEAMLEVGAIDEARSACEELAEIGQALGATALHAAVSHARGAIALAGGDAPTALPQLRHACRQWADLDAPYEAARARMLLGLACRALGDEDGAGLELEAARAAFEKLGAAAERARIDGLRDRSPASRPDGLTSREVEVLAAVATGRTNRAIAERLFISERTVARHLSNIFTKLGLSSRAAATAYAYEHGLAGPSAEDFRE